MRKSAKADLSRSQEKTPAAKRSGAGVGRKAPSRAAKPAPPLAELTRLLRTKNAALRELGKQLAESQKLAAQADEALKSNLNREKLTLAFAEIGICEFDPRSRMVRVSETGKRLLGFRGTEIDVPYDNLFATLHPDDRGMFDEVILQCINGTGGLDIEYRVQRPDGSMRWLRTKGDTLLDLQAKPVRVLWVIEDISQRKEAAARVHFLAHHDLLTGLPNRTLFRDRLGQAIAAARRMDLRIGVLFIDLDRFKLINDSFGHRVGDALLQSAAERMRHCVREMDTVCRHSGDEYLIALSGLHDPGEAAAVASKIVESFEQPFVLEEHQLSVGVSVGISIYPNDGQTVDELVRNADAAMYLAKRGGRRRFEFFKPELNAPAAERLLLGQQLRHGVEQGQLLMHYQPQIAFESPRIVAAEALLRWIHPQHGIMTPASFISIAEESDAIDLLGEWVLNEVCRQIAEWKRSDLDVVPVAINISAYQFRRADLAIRIANALSRHGVNARHIEIELTEQAIMQDPKETKQILGALSDMGMTLSINNFGTGYSSLSYLKRFAINKLKIDRSFITDLPHNRNDVSITQAIVSLAHNLELGVVAEGVENQAQFEFLKGIGCHAFQGYFGARPEAAQTFSLRLART